MARSFTYEELTAGGEGGDAPTNTICPLPRVRAWVDFPCKGSACQLWWLCSGNAVGMLLSRLDALRDDEGEVSA